MWGSSQGTASDDQITGIIRVIPEMDSRTLRVLSGQNAKLWHAASSHRVKRCLPTSQQ
jgi:hypothetical protein